MDPLRRNYHRVASVIEKWTVIATQLAGFAYRERQKPTAGIPYTQRLSLIRNGFHSTRTRDYDLERYDLSAYLPDFSGAVSPGQLAGSDAAIAMNKLTFHQILTDRYEDAIPTVYGVIHNGTVRAETGAVLTDDCVGWLREQLHRHERLVCKPVTGVGGANVYVLERSDDGPVVNGRELSLTTLVDQFGSQTTYLVNEFVDQAEYAETIFPDATNTIRVITLRDVTTQEPFVARAIHRFGVAASAPVDNWDKGGISAHVDIETGTMTTAAQNTASGIRWLEDHPETGAPITGISIPRWDRLREEITTIAAHLQQLPLVGWDIVITEDGYAVLEGNIRPTHEMMQIHEPFLTDTRVREFFDYHGVI
ncbi:sugar-transfer associated ATP-grasp domain-containing protein [Natrononativus amylolyticus]|uniref:sugar-transfer associated ATP-grasp domain-containing protein n=1 Tax=Natrononativus amylolyticus TaxID=2963434 RepID=UPI0020CCEBA6|nr:sugar-transfer associated ATP-grasp domain-containing protein [Natrononativus amylolyticus]